MHPIARQLFRRQLQVQVQVQATLRRASTAAASSSSARTCSSFGTPFLARSRSQTTRRSYSSAPPPPPGSNSNVKFWPFVAIIAAGTGAWVLLVNRRKEMPAIEAPKSSGQLPAPDKSTPTFSADDVAVVFVLGGPGAGKGTQCARLVADYGFTHLSAGDLLRAEQDRPGSQFGQLIKDYIREGKIVPMEVTVQLLENAMTEVIQKGDKKPPSSSTQAQQKKRAKFLIDGFPRKMDQAVKFEQAVCPAQFVLFYDCPEAEMEKRLLERGKTSGRADDNAESIRKRFRTFVETSMPVVDYFEKEGRVVRIDATPAPAAVYKTTQEKLQGRLGQDL